MKHQLLAVVVAAVVTSGPRGLAETTPFSFSGAGLGGSLVLTYGPNSVVGDPVGSYAITGVSGVFSDAKLGLSDMTITGLTPINPVSPYKGLPFPVSFSSIAVTNPPYPGEGTSYDNLYYPGGSPVVCPDYPGSGGYLDVFGVAFKLSNGFTVDLFSNGTVAAGQPLYYGVVVINEAGTIVDSALAVPEPASAALLGAGLLVVAAWGGRKRRAG